jgi:hypothetical protein
MAKIEFEAFVDKNLGWGLKTTEKHRRQVDGEWKDVGRTFRTVKAAYGVELDLGGFAEGSRVAVTGTEKTESREHNGKTYYDLVVAAQSVSVVEPRGRQVSQPVVQGPAWDTPADTETPF